MGDPEQREDRQREAARSLALLPGAHTERKDLSVSLFLCQLQLTLNNFIIYYVAEIQLYGNGIPLLPEHRVLARILLWLAIGDFHHIV